MIDLSDRAAHAGGGAAVFHNNQSKATGKQKTTKKREEKLATTKEVVLSKILDIPAPPERWNFSSRSCCRRPAIRTK